MFSRATANASSSQIGVVVLEQVVLVILWKPLGKVDDALRRKYLPKTQARIEADRIAKRNKPKRSMQERLVGVDDRLSSR